MNYRTWAALLLIASSSQALAWPANIDHVADGDTLTVVRTDTQERVRVRLEGIDAPETSHGKKRPGQPFGDASGDALRQLTRAGRIDIQPSGARSYDRIVARVLVDGRDVGHALVRGGLAWDSTKYDRSRTYAADQRIAQDTRAGLWSQPSPTPPWEWRRQAWR